MEFFVDRSLGCVSFVEAVRSAGLMVHSHDDLFAPDADDVEWIRHSALRGWVSITGDLKIFERPPERDCVMENGGALIGLVGNDLPGPVKTANFILAVDRIERFLQRHGRPVLAKLGTPRVPGQAGHVSLYLNESRWLATRPIT